MCVMVDGEVVDYPGSPFSDILQKPVSLLQIPTDGIPIESADTFSAKTRLYNTISGLGKSKTVKIQVVLHGLIMKGGQDEN